MWNKNISIFSRGLAGVPASHFPHERLSGRGERQLCPSQPSGTGTVWALGSCFYQSHGCPCAEHTEHPGGQALSRGSARAHSSSCCLPALCSTGQHRDSEGKYKQIHVPTHGQDVAELSCKSTPGCSRADEPSSPLSLCL